ncbi:adenylate/guanylate cyclase domain-containing protein [Exiguobacterium sp. K1]|uniref:adenylate/guanylate cyclase domain-containing protein n=1 Tax=Exiguobacterium sp. K1 TaxID=2980105 RepID=UPI00299DEA7A|nr:adenylate/guanylate cyclase domain-containing protein [Exiguobacterium sp. K1]MDX1260839.1 adenylate/guanylate cyclase domain-containing protein [Exiguobacterium sp. K1]
MPMISKAKYKEIETRIEHIFSTEMEVEDFTGDTVPTSQDLPDKNKGLIITNCTILFVDIRSSTKLSDKTQAKNMAKIYRAFARGMSMCINESGGRVRQIAGDRVMGVFVDDKDESSVKKAMHTAQSILTVVEHLFNPICRTNINGKEIGCGIGLDTGRILTTSIGMKHQGEDSRDLVWTGKTANVASKHTDLAEANEIFVTKRFYDKLPQSFKKTSNDKSIWEKTYRLKGDSVFEGYGVSAFYLDELLEEPVKESMSVTSSALSPEAGAMDAGQIVTDIVQGVETKLGDLLGNFEQVIRRENIISRKEQQLGNKIRELYEREKDIKRKEVELENQKQTQTRILEDNINKVTYDLSVSSLQERIDNLELDVFLKELKYVQDLGRKIGKKQETVQYDLMVWKLVMYLHKKGESRFAFKILTRQLTETLPSYSVPLPENSVPIIKSLGGEREYLEAATYHVENRNPDIGELIRIRNVLKNIGFESLIGKGSIFFSDYI